MLVPARQTSLEISPGHSATDGIQPHQSVTPDRSRRRSTPVSHRTFLVVALLRLVSPAFPEARRCPADRPITGGEKKCPIDPLSPLTATTSPRTVLSRGGMTIPRDMDRSEMLRECQCREGHLHPHTYPGSIYRPIWDPSSSNTSRIFWGRHIMLSCPFSIAATRDSFAAAALYTTRRSKHNAANPLGNGRMKLRTGRLEKTLEAKYNQACATQSHDSRRPSLCASHLPPADSRLPEARYTRVLRSTTKTSEVVVRHTSFMLSPVVSRSPSSSDDGPDPSSRRDE